MRVEDGLHPSTTTGRWKYEEALRAYGSLPVPSHILLHQIILILIEIEIVIVIVIIIIVILIIKTSIIISMINIEKIVQ
jgi:hypothetical protein